MCLHHVSCVVWSRRLGLQSTFILTKPLTVPAQFVPLHRSHASLVIITTGLTAIWFTSMPTLLQIGDTYSAFFTFMTLCMCLVPDPVHIYPWSGKYVVGIAWVSASQLYGHRHIVVNSIPLSVCLFVHLECLISD